MEETAQVTRPIPAPCIGVFDSGVGGLTVLRELRRQMPEVPLRYVADAAHAPYGERSPAYIAERSERVAAHLIERGARLLVVACNTATAHAIAALRARWPALPIVGTEPGIKPAVASSRNGRIGVLATPATLASRRFADLLERHAPQGQIVAQPCPGLVALIEAGDLAAPALRARVAEFCAPLREAGVDTVLMGCTHYPLVQHLIQAELGPEVRLLNIETAVAQQAARLWSALPPVAPPLGTARIELATSGDPRRLEAFVKQALGWQEPRAEHWDDAGAPSSRMPPAVPPG